MERPISGAGPNKLVKGLARGLVGDFHSRERLATTDNIFVYSPLQYLL